MAYRHRLTLMDAEGIDDRCFHIAVCRHCKLQVTLPQLSEAELSPWYHAAYHGMGYRRTTHPFSVIMNGFMSIRIRMIKRYLEAGDTIIDYGAGDGRFVQALIKKGVCAYGIEQDIFQSKGTIGRNSVRKPPDTGTILPSLETADELGIKPDVVTLWQVVEHLANPQTEIRRIHQALSTGGRIVISVPNIRSGQALITGAHWYHLDPPRHRWHFSEDQLRRLLETAGFDILRVNHFDFEFSPVGWWQSLLNRIHASNGFPLHYVKRGRCRFNIHTDWSRWMAAMSAILPGALLIPMSIWFSWIESACAYGGTLMLIGKKSRP